MMKIVYNVLFSLLLATFGISFLMANSSVRIIYEDKEFKIKTIEKNTAFGIFVPLGQTFPADIAF